jgi:hypothetical protein
MLRNIIFHEIPSSGTGVVPSVRTDGRAEMTKLVASFHSFTNHPNLSLIIWQLSLLFYFKYSSEKYPRTLELFVRASAIVGISRCN